MVHTGIKPALSGFITKTWVGYSWCRIRKIQYGCGLIIWADGIGLPKTFIHSYTTITLPLGYGSIQQSKSPMECVCSSVISTVKQRGTGNPDKKPNRELTVKTVADGCVGDSPPIGISLLLHKGLLKSALSCHSSEEHFVESRNYRANHV